MTTPLTAEQIKSHYLALPFVDHVKVTPSLVPAMLLVAVQFLSPIRLRYSVRDGSGVVSFHVRLSHNGDLCEHFYMRLLPLGGLINTEDCPGYLAWRTEIQMRGPNGDA